MLYLLSALSVMYILLMYYIFLLLLPPDGFVLCYIGLLVLTLWRFDDCLTQKDFLGKEERIFLINRTEHPRLAERVRCLCVGCDATWGPPCQALVTRLSLNHQRQTDGDRPAQ